MHAVIYLFRPVHHVLSSSSANERNNEKARASIFIETEARYISNEGGAHSQPVVVI